MFSFPSRNINLTLQEDSYLSPNKTSHTIEHFLNYCSLSKVQHISRKGPQSILVWLDLKRSVAESVIN